MGKEASASSVPSKSRQVRNLASKLQTHTHATIKSDIYFSNMGLREQIDILGQCWPDRKLLFVSPHLVKALRFLYIVLLSHHI